MSGVEFHNSFNGGLNNFDTKPKKDAGPSCFLKGLILVMLSTAISCLLIGIYVMNLVTTIELGKETTSITLTNKDHHIIVKLPKHQQNPQETKFLYQVKQLPLTPAVELKDPKPGLCYSYFEGFWNVLPNFEQMKPLQIGRVDQPNIKVARRPETMALQFYGYIHIAKDGLYEFYTRSDDGSKLYIDNKLVVNNDGIHGVREEKGSIALEAGFHHIILDFFERHGGQHLSLAYLGPDFNKKPIPREIFHHAASWNCPDTPPEEPQIPLCLFGQSGERKSNEMNFLKCGTPNPKKPPIEVIID